ncbi:MAG TPA: ATP-binding protein, partial [Thermodesulfobacteriota bacterium]|nr:ATP-binding protein [Thermodesulfobacteriota bacterium]
KEALGTLAGGIAHDLNNALFPILLSTDMMLLDLPEENPSRSLIQGMKTGAIRAKKLVEQILNFGSHRRMKEKKPVEIGSIVDECLVLVKAGTPANVEIQKDVLDDTALVLATSTHIHQVIMNLCTNAIHAMKDGGGVLRISVKRYKVEKGKSESAFDLSPGAYVRIIVSDTGKGMSRDIMDRIFDPYFTTKKRGEGTGLGLAIAHQIVTDLGGGIAVQSEMGKGTSFEVFLPEIKVPLEGEEGLSSSLPKGTERILFIDDEEICLCSMVPVLERLGYTVCAESSSVAALRMFRQDPRRFDLVVTDQSMPGLTGLELSQEFLKIRPDIPIVLVTGFSAAVDEQKAKQKGIREFMLKPFIIQDVAETIRRACEPR